MSKLERSIKTGQVSLRQLNIVVDATSGTPVISGFDKLGIDSVIDLGAGNHTIIFKRPFEQSCIPTGHCMFTVGGSLEITAVAYDRVTVQSKVATVAADAKFSLQITGCDSRLNY